MNCNKCKKNDCSCNPNPKLDLYNLAKTEGRAKNMSLSEYLDSVEGDEGEPGVGIKKITNKEDSSIEIELTDGTKFTTPPLKGEDGTGNSAFTSMVFKNTTTLGTPTTPTGGTFSNPYPTDTTWEKTARNTGYNYVSLRIFTSNGQAPQTLTWSTPMLISANSSVEVMWSDLESYPGTPLTNPENFIDNATENTKWIALKFTNSVTNESWQVIRLRGERGDDGFTPLLRINIATKNWEVSYDNGTTWIDTGSSSKGDKGDAAVWVLLTQYEYDSLPTKDPNVLYLISTTEEP